MKTEISNIGKIRSRIFLIVMVFTISFFIGCNHSVQNSADSYRAITEFNFLEPPAKGAIDEESKMIFIEVPFCTDVSSLIPVITHTGKSVHPESGIAQDFSEPVIYSVTAEDGSVQQYLVEVKREIADSGKAITEFYFLEPSVKGLIDKESKLILVEVPYSTDVSSLTPIITHTGKSVHPDSGVAQDFSEPVIYSVTAEDGCVQQYVVEVKREIADSGKAITNFYFLKPPAKGAIDEESKSILVEVPARTDISSLTPIITHTGKSVQPDSGVAQDFSEPVIYSVTAEDGSIQQYLVEVKREIADSSKAITKFYFLELSAKAAIDEEKKLILVEVPAATDISSLTPQITHTGKSIYPDSGVTQDFSGPMTYSVTAEDGSVQDYLVEVKREISDSDKVIIDFYIPALKTRGIVVEKTKEIYVLLPNISDVISVRAIATYIGKSISPDSTEALDLTNPVEYTVTAFDGSQSTYSVIVEKSNLPVLYINTPNSILIRSKEVWTDGASYKLVDENGFIFSGHVSIKGRGNTTIGMMPKTPFSIRLPNNDDKPFLGMPSHRRWVLLANYSDKSLLRTDVAFKLGEILDNLKWTPQARHIVLYLNEKYQGVYQLVEQIRIDPIRVNIAPTISSRQPNGGYLVEVDRRRGELFNFTTKLGLNICCKDPDENLDDVFDNIKSNIQTIEDVIFSDSFTDTATGYRKYIDIQSFVDYYLANEITKNNDAAAYASIYMYYNPADRKLHMGPIWDFDIALGNINYSECKSPEGFFIKAKSLWISRLFEDPAFVRMVKDRWNEKRTEVFTLLSYIKSQAAYLNNAQQVNFKKWDILDAHVWPNAVVTGSYDGEIEYLHSWLSSRLDWLDVNINLLDSD